MWRQLPRLARQLYRRPSLPSLPRSSLPSSLFPSRFIPSLTFYTTDSTTPLPPRRIRDDVQEYNERLSTGQTATFDKSPIPAHEANIFPRIKTTSLSTKRIVIHDHALSNSVTLVMVAFRSFADQQLQSWKHAFETQLPRDSTQWYDVTINESFGAQAFSGFIQRLQRGRTDPALHDFYVAFNSKAREPLETLLPSRNRMFGYVLLLDNHARVRFRASGLPTEDALIAFVDCAKQLAQEAEKEKIGSSQG